MNVVGDICAGSLGAEMIGAVLSSSCGVQVAEVEDTTSGGLLLTSSSSEKPTLGKVCKVA